MTFVLDQTHSVANDFLLQLRDEKLQLDRMRFRKNLERLGTLMAYELSKSLRFEPQEVKTVLGTKKVHSLSSVPVLIPILRAALPFYQGFLNIFDSADSGFVGAYRSNAGPADSIDIDMEYMTCGDIEGKVVILIDPMLATGRSTVAAANALRRYGNPSHFHFVAAIAAPEGIDYVQGHFGNNCSLWTASVDEKLDGRSYIIPGLGDAGDLCFGGKV